MDALSEALNAVHMTGAIFYYAECTSPWGFAVPALHRVAHMLAPGTERLVPYHLVSEGTALLKFDTFQLELEAGDVLIIPHGDAHEVSNGSPNVLIDSASSLGKFLAGNCVRCVSGAVAQRRVLYAGTSAASDLLTGCSSPDYRK